MDKNSFPEWIESIHLIAVCGTGMGALACMLAEKGYRVTGSDAGVYPPMSDFLDDRGIRVMEGFSPENLAGRPDLVIVGNAVSRGNVEVQAMFDQGLHFCSMPQALNRFFADGRKPLLVTGTHGKTTTSSMMAWLLDVAKLDPTFMIGGILKNFDSNYRLGHGEYVVIEGDEYDTAFFDKGPKFMHYDPFVTVLTSVEFDHADIFRDLDHVKGVFGRFLTGLGEESTLIACDGDENIGPLVENLPCLTERYGRKRDSGWSLGKVWNEPPFNRFEALCDGELVGEFKLGLPGHHNMLNALSVIAAGCRLGIPVSVIREALETFEGVKRRQEVRGIRGGITVIDDFAHHPTAVAETVAAVKAFYPGSRLVAVFEPRTNSSMRSVFQEVYPASFDSADLVCVRKPPLLHKIPEGERFSSEKLVADLVGRGKEAYYFEETDAILDALKGTLREGDVVLIMSNGGFDNIHARLLDMLGQGDAKP